MTAVAASDLDALVARLRFRISDFDSDIDSATLEQAIKDSVAFLSTATECFMKTESITPTTTAITLESEFITIDSVANTELSYATIRFCDTREYNEMAGNFACWYIKNDTLYVEKAARTNFTSIEVTYSYIPNIDDGESSESISEKHVPAVLAYAEYRLRAADRDGGLANRAYMEFAQLAGIEIKKTDDNNANLSGN